MYETEDWYRIWPYLYYRWKCIHTRISSVNIFDETWALAHLLFLLLLQAHTPCHCVLQLQLNCAVEIRSKFQLLTSNRLNHLSSTIQMRSMHSRSSNMWYTSNTHRVYWARCQTHLENENVQFSEERISDMRVCTAIYQWLAEYPRVWFVYVSHFPPLSASDNAPTTMRGRSTGNILVLSCSFVLFFRFIMVLRVHVFVRISLPNWASLVSFHLIASHIIWASLCVFMTLPDCTNNCCPYQFHQQQCWLIWKCAISVFFLLRV